MPLDIDGWGSLVTRLQQPNAGLADLFHSPSFWRGPVLPTIFGAVYLAVPHELSVLGFNAIVTGLAAGTLILVFTALGAGRVMAGLAVAGWLAYPPHWFAYGYYLSEPLVALLSALLFGATALTLHSGRPLPAAIAGLTSGLLLLTRPHVIVIIGGIGLWFALRFLRERWTTVAAFALAAALVYVPWPIRNFKEYGMFIPFTGDGGQALFMGTYLAGDGLNMGVLREMPEFKALEGRLLALPPTVRYTEWQRLARAQVVADPLGQLRLVVRKFLRFWVYLPPHGWRPSLRTLLAAILIVPLAIAGAWLGRGWLLVRLCTLWVGGLWLFHGLVYSELRYNYPVLPMALLLALVGARELATSWPRTVADRGESIGLPFAGGAGLKSLHHGDKSTELRAKRVRAGHGGRLVISRRALGRDRTSRQRPVRAGRLRVASSASGRACAQLERSRAAGLPVSPLR
jgi:hypothetical protein